jgi:tetratricopeptide (TPR) repeat protein
MRKLIYQGRLFIVPGLLVLILLVLAHMERRRETAEGYFKSFAAEMIQENYGKARVDIDSALNFRSGNAYYVANKGLVAARTFNSRPLRIYHDLEVEVDGVDYERVNESIRWYRRAIELNPNDDSFYHSLAWLYYFAGERPLAYENLRRAMQIDPEIALYHISLGLLLETENRVDEACSEYATALRLAPNIVDSPFFLELQERWPQRVETMVLTTTTMMEEGLANAPDTISKAKLSKLYWFEKRTAESVQAVKEVTSVLPGLSRPWLILGDFYQGNGANTAAELCYKKAAYLATGDYLAWEHLGRYLDRLDRRDAAINAYEEALSSWLSQRSVHAERAARLYQTNVIIPDDVVPKGLLSYTSPFLDAAAVCGNLARLYKDKGNEGRSRYYDELEEKFASFHYNGSGGAPKNSF